MAYTTIANPELYFQSKTYSGNGSTNAITLDGSENMQSDFIWFKRRDGADNHILFDDVRGVTKGLYSDLTNAEDNLADSLSSFDSNGFTLGADTGSGGSINGSSESCVAWCWKESATAGFDIVSFTGNGSARTISHSLSAKPDFFVVKGRTFGEQWECYHTSLGATKCLQWDDNSAEADLANRFNDTEPTSSVFTVGDADAVNKNTYTYITYLWRSVQGFSRFSKYTGNGNANGTFIHLGFRPAWFLVKRSDSANSWHLVDAKRNTFNPTQNGLFPDTNDGENTGNQFDFLANGVKLNSSDGGYNASGGTYIFMAFAEQPFVNSNGTPANAR